MIYDWYKLFNLDDFNATGLTSQTKTVILEGRGQKEVSIFKGIGVSIMYDDVFLTMDLNDKNPFTFENKAVYVDANNDIWLGIELEN